jgi:nucleoside-diphosphate-sugar epimerase
VRVLVTGAAGFVGRSVVARLAEDGHDVVAVDRADAPLRALAARHPSVSAAAVDLASRADVQALFEASRPDALIHLAWYADPTDYLTSEANLGSLEMTLSVARAALSSGCRKLIVGGSCVEYAARDRLLVEDDPVDPRTLYAACKHAAWHVLRIMASEAGAALCWARIFHIHGPTEDTRRIIPWVASQLRMGKAVELTAGSQIRDHLHIADVAGGLVALLATSATGIYNICSGEPVSLRQVLETVGEIVGRKELLQFGARPHRSNETMFLAGDSSRLRALGWRPRFGLRDGLEDALAGGRSR